MLRKASLVIACILSLIASADAARAMQCVAYAREASGMDLSGDAWMWWANAKGQYQRGKTPSEGSVLVFSRQGSMRYGHVSVVTKLVDKRVVLVNHANWAPHRSAGRGMVTMAVPVLDVSPNNDWSQVRVWHRPANDYGGRVYKTEGFIYDDSPTRLRSTAPKIEAVAVDRARERFPYEAALGRMGVNTEGFDMSAPQGQSDAGEPVPAPVAAPATPAARPRPGETKAAKVTEMPAAAPAAQPSAPQPPQSARPDGSLQKMLEQWAEHA